MTSPLRPLLGLFMLLFVSGCSIALAQSENKSTLRPEIQRERAAQSAPPKVQTVAQAPTSEIALPLGSPRQPADEEMTSIRIFQLDNQCEEFTGEVVQLPQTSALNDAVGETIRESNILNFDLAGYRISEGPSLGEVTIDLRLLPDEERMLQSLSWCEGLSLFGSIRRTLTNNGQLGVDQVRFTVAGRELR